MSTTKQEKALSRIQALLVELQAVEERAIAQRNLIEAVLNGDRAIRCAISHIYEGLSIELSKLIPQPSPSAPKLGGSPSMQPSPVACEFAACNGSGMRLESGAAVPCECGGRLQ